MGFIILLCLVVAGPLFFVILSCVVTFREKRVAWFFEPISSTPPASTDVPSSIDASNPYAPTASVDQTYLPLTAFAQKTGQQLTALGYQFVGSFRHSKGGIYKIRYDAMLSADGLILAMVESGTLMKIAVNNLSLTSFAKQSDGRLVEVSSITNESAFESSFCGNVESMLFSGKSTESVEYLHRQRLSLTAPQPFSNNPMVDLYEFRVRDHERAIELGWLRPVEQGVALPTLKGVISTLYQTYAFQLGSKFSSHSARVNRRVRANAAGG